LSYYLSHTTFAGAKPLDYAFIGGLNFGCAMLAAPLVTGWCRRTGIKPLMTAGATILGGGYVAASFATRIWHLYLTQGALVGLGVGFVYVPSLPVLSQWFDRRRSLANGISTAGSGVGGLIFSFATGAMLRKWSLAWALRTTGIAALVVNLVAAALIRDRNAAIKPKQQAFDRRLLEKPAIVWLLAWAFITLLYSLSDFAISIGLTSQRAVEITALLNTGTAIGRPWIGFASDRLGRFNVSIALTFFCGLCCFAIWIPADSYGVTLLFAIISGAILGVFWVVSTTFLLVQGKKPSPSD
jgi:MFS family permease